MTHERLESRRYMDDAPILIPTATIEGGTLIVTGTDNADKVNIRLNSTGTRVVVDIPVPGQPALKTFVPSLINRINVDGLNGADRIEVRIAKPMTILGSGGNDRLFNRTAANATIIGGAGSDRLSGGPSRDRLDSSIDDGRPDTLVGMGGNDSLLLGSGREVLDYSQQTFTPIRFVGGDNNALVRVEIGTEIDSIVNDEEFIVIGTTGPDVFIRGNLGTARRRFVGGDGSDTFTPGPVVCEADGGNGNDVFSAAMPRQQDDAPDQMQITGGAGDDEVLILSTAADAFDVGDFNLGEGNDMVNLRNYGLPTFRLFTEQSIDRILNLARFTPMSITGTAASERIVAAGNFAITVMGNGGNDNIEGSRRADMIFGNDGNDRLSGNGGNDVINGGNNDDTISGGSGRDTIFCEEGDDWAYVDDGEVDILDGGPTDIFPDQPDYDRLEADNGTNGEPQDVAADFNELLMSN